MSQTRMVSGQHLDADVIMRENAAAAALVDVAAGFVKKASDSASSSSAGGLLPTNNASRKQWDREQAAPPTDHGITRRSSTTEETITGPTPQATNTSTTLNTPGTVGPIYQPPAAYHTPLAEHHGGAVPAPHPQPLNHPQVPQPLNHPQVPRRPQQQQQAPAGGSRTADAGRWPSTAPPTHQPPPSSAYPPHHAAAPPPPHVSATHIHHAAHTHPHTHTHTHPHHAHHVAAAAAAAHAHHAAAAAAAAAARQQATVTAARPAVAQQQPASAVLMSMSSIGFGVAPASSTDATEAVIRAVQDSMERSAVRLPTVASLRQSLTIHLKLGVPPKATGEPMNVDVSRLSLFLPQSVPLLPVEVVVGGLLIDHKEIEESTMKPTGGSAVPSQQPTICTAVACVTLQQSAPETIEQTTRAPAATVVDSSGLPASVTVRTPHTTTAGTSPWSQVVEQQQQVPPPPPANHAAAAPPPPPAMAAAPALGAHAPPPPATTQHRRIPSMTAVNSTSSNGSTTATNQPPPQPAEVHRTNSMEVLAQISGEIRDRQINASKNHNGNPASQHEAAAALAMVCSSEAASLEASAAAAASADQKFHRNSFSSRGSGVSLSDCNSAYSYKKLAPGVTPKGSKRLFVRHDYKDYSREQPLPEEQFLVRSDAKTPNAAFPLKLHETLSQIEQDGYGHIIGWMPHGRSFKIHQQQDFVDIILPRYFVMTKKSSFLRQLNLYNFNRISVGPDSGSYYHEKFLRGLKFLCRRMSRQKVNGNGIRAAGNPDDEPTLANYPSCPPKPGGSNSCDSSSVSHNDSDNQDTDPKDNGERPYSRLVGGPPSRPYSQAVRSSAQQSNGGAAAAAAPMMAVAAEKEATVVSDEGGTQDSIGSNKKGPTRLTRTDSSSSSSQASFPLKLQRILDKADAEGRTDIISWLPHGRAFLVHDVDRFVAEVMSQHFNQTKYSSFQRQLHMYNFQRITFGRDKGAYHHDKFHRGRPDLCMTMVRTRVNGKGCRRPGDPDNEPDFYVDWEATEGSPGGGNDSQSEQQGDAAMETVRGEPV